MNPSENTHTNNIQAKLEQAIAFIEAGKADEAEKLVREILPAQPDNVFLLNYLGNVEAKKGRYQESLSLFERSLASNASQPPILFAAASVLSSLGRNAESLAKIDQVLRFLPTNYDVHRTRALLLKKLDRPQEALLAFTHALQIKPDYADAYVARAELLSSLGRHEEAVADFDQAIRIQPQFTQAHFGRGNALRGLNRNEEALIAFDRAIAINPKYAPIHNNRANALVDLERYKEALLSYHLAVQLEPTYAAAYFNLGRAYQTLDSLDIAIENYKKALQLSPDYLQAKVNLGTALNQLRRLDEAKALYDEILKNNPDTPDALNNRGNVYKNMLAFNEALADYDRAIALRPDYAEAINNRGNVLYELKRFDEAFASFDRCLSLAPDFADAHWNKAIINLLLGNYEEGWKLYEWRWLSTLKKERRTFGKPLWLGQESIEGKAILIHSEQGLGDTIQFCRYLPMMSAYGAKVYFECRKPLVSLLATLKGEFTVIPQDSELPDFDVQCPLMSLPHVFGTTLDTVPAPVPYLSSLPDKRAFWRGKLDACTKHPQAKNIGLVWAGRPQYKNDHKRSLAFDKIARLLDLPFNFHSLQKEYREGDLEAFSKFDNLFDHASDLNDFSDTAALMDELDLIITVDTSTAHLAGALGRPVWILLPWMPDYRWLLDRADSPWYPSARLFRQPALQDWDSVLSLVMQSLSSTYKPRSTY